MIMITKVEEHYDQNKTNRAGKTFIQKADS